MNAIYEYELLFSLLYVIKNHFCKLLKINIPMHIQIKIK